MNNLLQYDDDAQQCVLEIACIDDPVAPEIYMGEKSIDSIRMGDPFFRSFYSVYDVPNRRIGLALSALAPDGSGVIPGEEPQPHPPAPTQLLHPRNPCQRGMPGLNYS